MFTRAGQQQFDLEFLRNLEETYAPDAVKQVRDSLANMFKDVSKEAVDGSVAGKAIEGANSVVNTFMHISGLDQIQNGVKCMGMCSVPKYKIFSNNTRIYKINEVRPKNVEYYDSCSAGIMAYLVQFVQVFSAYCMWHTKMCIL